MFQALHFPFYFHGIIFNPSPNNRILNLSIFKAFATDSLNVAKMVILVFERVKKTLWEKEKMLVTSIFSFSRDVFKISLPLGSLTKQSWKKS